MRRGEKAWGPKCQSCEERPGFSVGADYGGCFTLLCVECEEKIYRETHQNDPPCEHGTLAGYGCRQCVDEWFDQVTAQGPTRQCEYCEQRYDEDEGHSCPVTCPGCGRENADHDHVKRCIGYTPQLSREENAGAYELGNPKRRLFES